MDVQTSSYKISFDDLMDLFTRFRKSEHISVLDSYKGKGFVQIFNLEKGLKARCWDCSFNNGIEMFSDTSAGEENTYFTLAFFLSTQGLQFANRDSFFKENIIWDTIFISAISNYRMYIPPFTRCCCLSISFSKKWLNKNVLKGEELEKLKEKIFMTESFSLFESMNLSEKKIVQELFDVSWKKYWGSFYIKSCVLKIISDFFYKIKERETFNINNAHLDNSIAEVKKYLNHRLTGTLPNLKDLAYKFSISESTLKRHFKNRYGVNISTYFMQKKMEYARHLIHEKHHSITETAYMLGYRNVNHFITMFKKYNG